MYHFKLCVSTIFFTYVIPILAFSYYDRVVSDPKSVCCMETGHGWETKLYSTNSDKSDNLKSTKGARSLSKPETWRLYNVEVLLDKDPGKDETGYSESLMQSVVRKLDVPKKYTDLVNSSCNVTVVRKSFDARARTLRVFGQPIFVYTVDLSMDSLVSNKLKFVHLPGRVEKVGQDKSMPLTEESTLLNTRTSEHRCVVVGSGPAGLFAALTLASAGFKPIIIERGQPVEQRGRDIGALFHRAQLDPNSNLCFGEGGAGTWSDGKLTTRIGKNSEDVRFVLDTLVKYVQNR